MEVFVGSYKDGTEGNRDYRLTAGLYLIGQILIGVGWSINHRITHYYGWLVIAVPFVLFTVAFALFKPHRKWSHNVVDVLLLLLIAKMCICAYTVVGTTISEPTLRIIVLLILIDLAIPQIIQLVCCGIKLVSWACSRDENAVRRNYENHDNILPQSEGSTSESQPLLHP